MPRILLKYKCVPCDLAFTTRAEYVRHNAERHHAVATGEEAICADNGGGTVRIVFAAPASSIHTPQQQTTTAEEDTKARLMACKPTEPPLSLPPPPAMVPNGLSRLPAPSVASLITSSPMPRVTGFPKVVLPTEPVQINGHQAKRSNSTPKKQIVTKTVVRAVSKVSPGLDSGFVRQCELCQTRFKSVKSHKRHMDRQMSHV